MDTIEQRVKMINLDDLDDDIILCNVCNNEFDDQERSPKLLPCLCTLCQDCSLNSMRGSKLECSICKVEHILPSDLELLKDSTMTNVMEMIKIQRKSSSIECPDCPDNNKADAFCKDCYDFLCKVCTDAHKRTQMTRRHVVMTIEDFKSSAIENFSKKEMCSLPGHEDQPLSFYCENGEDQKPVCTQCALGEYSQANGYVLRNLGDVYNENKHILERQIGELLNKVSDISSNAKKLESETDDIERTRMEVISEIDKTFGALEVMLKERKEKLKQRVDVICEQRRTDVNNRLKSLQKSKADMEKCCGYSSRMLFFTNKCEFLVLKPTVISQLEHLSYSENEEKPLEPVKIKFNAGIEQSRLEDIVNNIGEITTNVYGDMTNGTTMNGHQNENLESKLPYRGPPINPPGKFMTNKFPNMRPTKLNPPGARVEPLKLESITNEPPKQYKGVKMSPTEGNTLGRPLSLKSPVITPSKQPTSLGDFLKGRAFQLVIRCQTSPAKESQESSDSEERERQLPKTPTPTTPVPSSVILTKKSPVSPSIAPVFPPKIQNKPSPTSPKYPIASPTSPKYPMPSQTLNGGVSPTSPPYIQSYSNSTAFRPTKGHTPINYPSMRKTVVNNNETSPKAVSWKLNGNGQNNGSPIKPQTLVLSESSYPEVKQSTPSPRKTTPDKPVTFGDISCPDFQMDVATAHHEREVTTDGRMLRNKKTDTYSQNQQVDIENSLVQYKGAIGTHAFQDPGKFYYEVDVVYNIQQPLEETWLVFEIGLCRLDDVDMHHTVERHEFARSFYVARYPEDGKLTQEFWHNRDLLHFQSLSDNSAGLEVRVTYGFVVDTKRKKWTVVDCNNNKVLYNFDVLDFTEALYPVFGCYNPDLISVEMTLKTGTDITIIPQCLKTGFSKS